MSDLVPLAFKTDPALIRAVDAARGPERVSRSLFIRQAIAEKLAAMGMPVGEHLVYAPDRAGESATPVARPAPAGGGKAVSYKATAKAARGRAKRGHGAE